MWLEIDVLTPVHVGTGELLSSLEYSVNGRQIRVADLGRLFRQEPARAEAIGQRLAAANPAALRGMTLDSLLTRQELANESLWRYRLPGSDVTLAALAGARGREHEVRLASKTPDGRAYLPGTAIKGAFRTALIFAWSAASPEWARRLLEQPNPGVANKEVQQVLYGARRDPNHDLLRALAVGDTSGVPPSEALQLAQERVLSARIRADRSCGDGDDEYKAFLVFLECLKPGERLAASVRILGHLLDVRNTRVLEWSERQRALTPQTLCDAANRMSAEVCTWELDYFGLVRGRDCSGVIQFYRDLLAKLATPPANVAYLCLGRGAGWHKLTPGILVARYLTGSAFVEFRKKYGLAAFGRFDRLAFAFPKSRKVIAEGDRAAWPLGWVRMAFSDTEPVRPQAVVPPRPQQAPPQSLPDLSQEPQAPAVPIMTPEMEAEPPKRSAHAEAVEGTIRTLKAHEVSGRLQAIAAEIGRCPAEERAGLVRGLRERMTQLGFRPREIREMLGRYPQLGGEEE